MRKYELVVIVTPEFDEEATSEVIDKIKGWISDSGGSLDNLDHWGRRRFAYEIKGHKDGQYFIFDIDVPPTFVADLERNMRLQEPILRYLITRKEE